MCGQPKAVVVGAGIAGLCVARELALREWRVEIFEDPEMRAASRAATGLLQIAGGRISATHLGLRQRCRHGYEDFLQSLNHALQPDIPLAMSEIGHLRLTAQAEKLAGLRSFASTLRGLGVEAEFLERDRLWSSEPALRGLALGAVRLKDAAVESDGVLDAVRRHLEILGVIPTQNAVVGIEGVGLRTQEGQIVKADVVVLACGAGLSNVWNSAEWTPRLDPGWRLSFQGSLALRHSAEWVQKPSGGGTLVPAPDGGQWWVGGSGNSEDRTPLGRELASLCRDGTQVARRDGVRITVGDGLPVAGPVADTKGLYLLTGLGRNGLLTAPVLAQGLAETIHTGTTPDWLRPFGPERAQIGLQRSWSRPHSA